MKKLILLITILLPFVSMSNPELVHQENLEAKKDTVPKFLKNEFGLAINPVLLDLLGGNPWMTRWALTYRRHLNEKLSLRGVAAFYFNDYNLIFDSDWNYSYNADSTVKYANHQYKEKYEGYRISTGLQFNWGKKKLKWFTGMDLSFGNIKTISHTDSIYYARDTIGLQLYTQQSSTEIWKTINRSKQFGLTPFIGIRAMFSKHWGFSAHIAYQFYYAKESYVAYDHGQWFDGEGWQSLNISTDSFFEDVSIIFRF